ncbi:UPF0052 domain protein [Eremomyces bilateralis CBS 781.70]|uniref:UPF0052 domain protein n=1 Tax=Eremomyces bilateralis CBS 781.70 TaxID=1392243 RepID=A0A6G1GAK1_9PEZI|nr:UPF0052 domain protein [Eremomyces bilateralis CBS 781.70]KAF1815054.1 UPF0052 domain protein [Eremomyces bilateralis CBS 781.70]
MDDHLQPLPALLLQNGSRNRKGIVVFSGGSAANNLVDVFSTLVESRKCNLSYVIPISDNGGSSSELIRVVGGPGIGDVRSRLVRLIPEDDDVNSERTALHNFFNHRLAPDPDKARHEWLEIVEARSPLWSHIPSEKKELIRSILNHVNQEIVKRIRPSSTFNFSAASIGNLFLTGARLFTGSFESAIYLLSNICRVPHHVSVLPAINTNFAHHIAAGLTDGTSIVGQNAISHPSEPTSLNPHANIDAETNAHDSIEDANLPGTLPTLRKQYISFSKHHEEDLPSRIDRIWYINPYGQEIGLLANPKVVAALDDASAVIFSIGSLYTSIIPSLILRGVGERLASPAIRNKVLILNGTIDRETGPSNNPYTAVDFIAAIARAAATSRGQHQPPDPHEYRLYVTHLIHLDGDGAPKVDKDELSRLGIETIRLYGRKMSNGKGLGYDGKGLTQALEATIGKRDPSRSRRNTLNDSYPSNQKPDATP